MKTADLIPFILFELNERDKYGFELTKDIETKSNGKIVIKQPTLYTVLKKLEKSRFISSYWQDSEIGGKRHYYKITENGKMQLATLPSYDFLLNNLENDTEYSDAEINQNSKTDETIPTPSETVLPSSEVFKQDSLDNLTELNINIANSDILKDEKTKETETFAENENVSTFVNKTNVSTPVQKPEKTEKKNNILDIKDFSVAFNNEPIKFVEYVNIKQSNEYKKSKKLINGLKLKSILTSVTILFMLTLCTIISNFTGKSALFYIFTIVSLLIALFYPLIIALKSEKIREKYLNNKFSLDNKKSLILSICAMSVVVVITLVVNICIKNNTLVKILAPTNFENFYAPIILTSCMFFDLLYGKILLKK